ncbi:MAG: Ig-like domain repeat protein, partial [Christensenellaceae bacterium]
SAPTTVSATPVDWTNQTKHKLSWAGIKDYVGLQTLTDNWGVVEYSFDNTGIWTSTGIRNGSFTDFEVNTSTLLDGEHKIYVRGKDNQGNYGIASFASIKIDRTGPTMPTLLVAPSTWTNLNAVNLSWSGIADNRGLNRIELKMDSNEWVSAQTNAGNYTNKSIDISGLEDGTHTIGVRGIDSVGNIGQEKLINVYKDTTMPQIDELTITPKGYTNENEVVINWSGVSDVHSGIAKIEYEIDNEGVFVDTTSTAKYGVCGINIQGLIDGEHHIKLKITDLAGNVNEQKEVTFFKDYSAPQIEITYPTQNDFALGKFEVWGNVQDIALKEWVLSVTDLAGNVTELKRDNITGVISAIVDLETYENGEIVSFHLSAKDKAGNESTVT